MKTKEYDTIVIGSGGGTKLVRPVANLGKKVAIIEKESPGGTCLNRGCIPSKMLIYPSTLIHLTNDLSKFSMHRSSSWQVDFESLVNRISNTVDEESASIPPLYENHPNIDYYNLKAKFINNKEIQVGEEILTAKKIFIAAGGRPNIPKIPGLEGTPYWTSREALRNTKLPKTLAVYGGGYIGLELGMAYLGYGSNVTFITRSIFLKNEDHEIRDALQESISRRTRVITHSTIQSVDYKNGLFYLQLSGNSKEEIQTEALLIATGIQPNTDDLGLENTDIELDPNGFIKTNEFLETSVPGVYAFGDIIGRYMFRHSANFEGEYLFHNLYIAKKPKPIHYPPMPHAVFSFPELASVGLTEEACRTAGFDYIKAVHPYKNSAMGMARLPEDGLVKILLDKHTKEVLGAHILGEEASNLIHMIILGMTTGCKLNDYLDMIYIHPALAEVVRNAFRKLKENLTKPL